MSKLVGILNLTPDSFSDGGLAFAPDDALRRVDALLEAGADVVDIGAESTRPGAQPLSAEEEWARLGPVLGRAIERIHARGAIASLDTRHAATARRATSLGVDWINDVNGLQDSQMVEAVKDSACMLVLMHSLSVPADPNITLPQSCDAVAEVEQWFRARIDALKAQGIRQERLILDAGIGFGKTAKQSLALLLASPQLKALGLPLLVGHSRKSFLKLFSQDAAHRDALTLAFSSVLASMQADYLRVHDVARHRRLMGATGQ